MTATAHRLIAARPGPGRLIDGAAAVAALAGSLAILTHGLGFPHRGPGPDPLGFALVAAATVPLVVSRTAPFAVFVVTAAAATLASGLGYALEIPLGPSAALYLLAARRHETSRWAPYATAAAAALFVVYVSATGAAQGGFPANEFLHTGLAWTAAWFAGERTRLLRDRMVELEERAERAEREAERERRLAVAEERARIARDLHDTAGHALNVITVRAGAARLRHAGPPDRTLRALEAIEEVARQTAGDIDQIVHTLREDGSTGVDLAAPPGLASLDTLAAHHSQAGLDVTVRRTGNPRTLAHAADQAAYRIVQEALTNAARHGTGPAEIALAFQDAALELTVCNPSPEAGEPRSAGGHGLIGMRERAMLLGGTLEVSRDRGRFRVSARIPYLGRRA